MKHQQKHTRKATLPQSTGGAVTMEPNCRDSHGTVTQRPDAQTAWGKHDMVGTRKGGLESNVKRAGSASP